MEIGLSKEPANLVLETLRTIRADVARVDEKIDVKIDGLRNEPRLSGWRRHPLHVDVAKKSNHRGCIVLFGVGSER